MMVFSKMEIIMGKGLNILKKVKIKNMLAHLKMELIMEKEFNIIIMGMKDTTEFL